MKAEEETRIVVYGLNFAQGSSDAFLALPCDQLPVAEYEYYAVSYGTQSARTSRVLLVGCSDDTTVTTPSSTLTLNRLETYVIESEGDITGTRIVSNKPISFFPSHQCAFVPAGIAFCDHLTEQTPPTAIWGQSFLAASFLGRRSSEIFRILAAANATTVTVNCTTFAEPSSFILDNAGSWREISVGSDSFCSIESNRPILVMEFSLGFTLDDTGHGDPFMTMIPPVEQNSNNYVFSVLPDFSTNFITVFVAPEFFQSDRIFIDRVSLQNSTWTEVYCTSGICGFITRVPLQPGEHRLYHQGADARVGLIAYGFNRANSYGYPGGLQLVPIQCKLSIGIVAWLGTLLTVHACFLFSGDGQFLKSCVFC